MKKSAFGMYKSAEEHNKIGGKLSSIIFIFPILIFILVYLGVYISKSYSKKVEPQKTGQVTEQTRQPEKNINANSSAGVYANAPAPVAASATDMRHEPEQIETAQPNLKASDFEPTIAGQPWTAPIYNSLNRNIQSMPFPAICVIFDKRRCTCYTEQSTPIREIPKATCRDYVKNGIFNPYKQAPQTSQVIQQSDGTYTDKQPENSAQVLTLSGKPLPSLSTNNSEKVAVVQ